MCLHGCPGDKNNSNTSLNAACIFYFNQLVMKLNSISRSGPQGWSPLLAWLYPQRQMGEEDGSVERWGASTWNGKRVLIWATPHPFYSWASSGPSPSGQQCCFYLPQEVSSLRYKPKAGGTRCWEASRSRSKLPGAPREGRAEGLPSFSARGQAASWHHRKRGPSRQETSSFLALLSGACESLGKFPDLF